jgi:hypothetical protein
MQKLGSAYSQQPLVRFHSKTCFEWFRHWRTQREFQTEIAPVVAENKSRPIWGWSIQPKRTVLDFLVAFFSPYFLPQLPRIIYARGPDQWHF